MLLKQGFAPLESPQPSAADLDAVEGEKAVATATADLGEMTKVELLQYASDAGIAVNQYGTKKEILSAILAAKEPHAEAN